jgi:hypothetical protein
VADKLVYVQNLDSGEQRVLFQCPGCDNLHCIRTKPATGSNQSCWGYDGNTEKPTFSPSVLTCPDEPERRCHIFVKEGKIQYLSDCWHAMKNTTVDMVKLPFGDDYFAP